MRLAPYAFASAVLLAGTVAFAADDLTLVATHTRGDEPPTTATSYFTSDKMRMSQGNGQDFIADYASGNMTVLDGKKKEYFVITPADVEAMSTQMAARMKEMDAKTANLPPAIREKMAAAMGGGPNATVEVQKGTGGRTIAGYACQNWIVTMGTSMKQENCVSSDIAMPPAAYDALKRFGQSMANMGPMGKSMTAMWEKFKDMKGVPLATSMTMTMMGKTIKSSSEVKEVKKGPVPASAFEIPADYKKVDSPMAKMTGGPR